MSGPAARGSPLNMKVRRLVGENVAYFRHQRGLTQKQLATATKLSIDWISTIENGRPNPTLDILVDLAKALGVSLSDLVTPRNP